MGAVAGELTAGGTGVGEAGHQGTGCAELEYVVGDFGDHGVGFLMWMFVLWWSVYVQNARDGEALR